MQTRLTDLTMRYSVNISFKIPDNVFLLGPDDNDEQPKGTVGSWYVQSNMLCYIDANGDEQEIESPDSLEMTCSNPEVVNSFEKCITESEYEAYVRAFNKKHSTLVPTSYTDYKMQRDKRDQEKAAYDAKVDELAKMGIVYRSIKDN